MTSKSRAMYGSINSGSVGDPSLLDPYTVASQNITQEFNKNQEKLRKERATHWLQWPIEGVHKTLRAVGPAYFMVDQASYFNIFDRTPDIGGLMDFTRPLKLSQLILIAALVDLFYQLDNTIESITKMESLRKVWAQFFNQENNNKLMLPVRALTRPVLSASIGVTAYFVQNKFPQTGEAENFVSHPIWVTLAVGGGAFMVSRAINAAFESFQKTRAILIDLGVLQNAGVKQRLFQGMTSIGLDFARALFISKMIIDGTYAAAEYPMGPEAALLPVAVDSMMRMLGVLASPEHVKTIYAAGEVDLLADEDNDIVIEDRAYSGDIEAADESKAVVQTKGCAVKRCLPAVGYNAMLVGGAMVAAYGANYLFQDMIAKQFGVTNEADKGFGQYAAEASVPFMVFEATVGLAKPVVETVIAPCFRYVKNRCCMFSRGGNKDVVGHHQFESHPTVPGNSILRMNRGMGNDEL